MTEDLCVCSSRMTAVGAVCVRASEFGRVGGDADEAHACALRRGSPLIADHPTLADTQHARMVSDLSSWTLLISQQQEETARAQKEENDQLERVSSDGVPPPSPVY